MANTGYPAATFNITDKSSASNEALFSPSGDGLCVPFAFIMAERGVPGEIVFGGAKELTAAFGAATFDTSSKFFNASNQMLGRAMAQSGVEAMRLVDPAATKATLGLFLQVQSVPVVQYQLDGTGGRVIDANGNPISRKLPNGTTPVTEPGVSVKWVVRGLTTGESFRSLKVVTQTISGVSTTIYPIVALEMTSVGSYGDRQGFSFFSVNQDEISVAETLNSAIYRFVPWTLPLTVSTTASVVADTDGQPYEDVTFKSDAVYTPTSTNYAFGAMGAQYIDRKSGNTTLPYNMFIYNQNVKTVGQLIVTKSPELVGLDPYAIDLITGLDNSGNPLLHLNIDPASDNVVNSSVINYAIGGSDGDTSWLKFQELVRNWVAGSDHGEFINRGQHPMTHFTDPGLTMLTKIQMFSLLDLRDNFKLDMSTQDITLPANTKAQDIANAVQLLFRAQMHPNSIMNGVGCSRVGLYAHAAELVDGSPYGGIIPLTYDRLMKRTRLDGGSFIKGSSGGFPNSRVTGFRKLNWVADADSVQALSWASCLNTVRHASMNDLYYASLRTTYPDDTSLFSDDEVSDRIIYIYKICRRIFARWAGVRRDPSELYSLIQRDADNEIRTAMAGDNIKAQSTVYQTAYDKDLGYAVTAGVAVTGILPLRVFNFDVSLGRIPTSA